MHFTLLIWISMGINIFEVAFVMHYQAIFMLSETTHTTLVNLDLWILYMLDHEEKTITLDTCVATELKSKLANPQQSLLVW